MMLEEIPFNLSDELELVGELFRPLAEEKGATLSQLVIAWTLRQPGITVALAGARNEAQVIENAGAADVELSVKEVAMVNAKLKTLSGQLDVT